MERRIWLGYADKSCKQPIWYNGESHGLIDLRTRGGKGSCYLIPIGLTYEGSMMVNDPKGQWLAVCGRYRRDVLGQKIYVLNPYKILQKYLGQFFHATYDPVTSQMDPNSETFAADADNVFEGLIPNDGKDPHWPESARLFGSGISMHLRRSMNCWSLAAAYLAICSSGLYQFCEDEINQLRDDLIAGEVDETIEEIIHRLSRFGGERARENREIQSVVSHAITKLGWLSNKPISRNMQESTVDFARMKHEPMTVVLVSPARYLRTCNAWTRTMINAWADAMLREEPGEFPVLGLLDEFPTSVGNLSSVETLSALGAGFGCQLITVVQNLNQLAKLMPNGWETWLGNTGFQLHGAPGAGDMFTSKHISAMCGMVEVESLSRSISERKWTPQLGGGMIGALNGLTSSLASGDQISIGQIMKPYLSPEAIRELGDDEALAWVEGIKGVIRSGRRPYYRDPHFAGKYDPDPYHTKKGPS